MGKTRGRAALPLCDARRVSSRCCGRAVLPWRPIHVFFVSRRPSPCNVNAAVISPQGRDVLDSPLGQLAIKPKRPDQTPDDKTTKDKTDKTRKDETDKRKGGRHPGTQAITTRQEMHRWTDHRRLYVQIQGSKGEGPEPLSFAATTEAKSWKGSDAAESVNTILQTDPAYSE